MKKYPKTSETISPHPSRRVSEAFLYGARLGAGAGFVANLCLAGWVAALVLFDDAKIRLVLDAFFYLALFGTPVSLVVGALTGSVGGVALAALSRQEWAPSGFAGLASCFPFVYGLILAFDADLDLDRISPVSLFIAWMLLVLVFFAIGNRAGLRFYGRFLVTQAAGPRYESRS